MQHATYRRLQAAFHLAFRVYRFAGESHPQLEAQVSASVQRPNLFQLELPTWKRPTWKLTSNLGG
jgi:hypothetical protein